MRDVKLINGGDHLVRGMSYGGMIRAVAVTARETVDTAQRLAAL